MLIYREQMNLAVRAFANFLFVPGNRPERYAKALASGADSGLPRSGRLGAAGRERRCSLERHWQAIAQTIRDGRLALRVNGLRTAAGLADILAVGLHRHAPEYLFVPMVESAAEIGDTPQHIEPDHVAIRAALIESVNGLRAAHDIAAIAGRCRCHVWRR